MFLALGNDSLLTRNASLYYKQGTQEEKHRIVQMVFLDVCFSDKKLASYKVTEAFLPLENRDVTLSGGADGT